MQTSLLKAWSELLQEVSPVTTGYRMRLVKPLGTVRCFAGLRDPGAERALLIEVASDTAKSRFMGYGTRSFSVEVNKPEGLSGGAAALVLTLRDPAFLDLFGLMAGGVASAVAAASSPAEALLAAAATLDKWRGFLQRHSALLSREEVRGLIGELVILARLNSLVGPTKAVEVWQGPIGGLRDFECDQFLIEVKTFAPSMGASVQISDPLQLEGSATMPVRLLCVPLDSSEHGATLGQFAAATSQLLRGDSSTRELFIQRLAAAGFLESMAEALPERFTAHEPQAYLIGSGFPRITPTAVPQGVRAVKFSVELAALGRFAIPTDQAVGTRSATPGLQILA